jgi:hypothetical protein
VLPYPWGASLSSDPPSLGSSVTGYAGSTGTRTDAAGNTKVTTTDGIGRTLTVNQGNSVSTASYSYSGLATTVTQSDVTSYSGTRTQTRTMIHTSLGRLRSANNPENGTVSYIYFPGGALKSRTDARSATMTIPSIDGLARSARTSYLRARRRRLLRTPSFPSSKQSSRNSSTIQVWSNGNKCYEKVVLGRVVRPNREKSVSRRPG